MTMDLDTYKKTLHKYSVTDCAVRKNGIYVFVVSEILSDEELEEYEEEGLDQFYRPKKIVTFIQAGDPSQNGRQWFYTSLIGWDTPRIGASNLPKNHSVTFEISLRRNDIRTFVTGSGPAHEELIDIKPGDSFPRGGMTRLKTIEGYLYACGGSRDVGKRIGENNWISLVNNLPQLKRETTTDAILESGFEDVDGFSETDIYAGGGRGDLWHFDGENWEPIPFPTNDNIFSLCCAGDGYVYVCCTHGMTFKGRGDNWKKISNGKGEKSFRDMVWHKDRVYCTNDYGLWTIKDDELEKTDVPDEIFACSGHLYANDGVMLLAGLGGAAYCEDGEWTLLYNSSTMDALLELQAQQESKNIKLSYTGAAVPLAQQTIARMVELMEECNAAEIESRTRQYQRLAKEAVRTDSLQEFLDYYASIAQFSTPVTDNALNSIIPPCPFPEGLLKFYQEQGGFYGGCLFNGLTIYSLDDLFYRKHHVKYECQRFHSLGLADMINYNWEGRDELDPTNKDAMFKKKQIQYLNSNYTAVGVWTDQARGEEAHYYIYYDKYGRFGILHVDQDEWDIDDMFHASPARLNWDQVMNKALDDILKDQKEDEDE